MRHLLPRVGLLLTALPLPAASEWPRFRGPSANGSVPDDPRLPVRWSQTENVVWKTDLKGLGWSSPVVTGNRVFLTGVYSDQDNANEQPKAGLYLGQGRQDIPKGTHHWLTYVLTEGGKFNLEHTNSLDGLCLSTPAIADGKLLIRTSTRLYCLGAKDRK